VIDLGGDQGFVKAKIESQNDTILRIFDANFLEEIYLTEILSVLKLVT